MKKVIATVVAMMVSGAVLAAPPAVNDTSAGQPVVVEGDRASAGDMLYVGAQANVKDIVVGMMGGNVIDSEALLGFGAVTGDKRYTGRVSEKIAASFNNLNAVAAKVAQLEAENAALRAQSNANSDALGMHKEIDGQWGKPYTAANVLTAYHDTKSHAPKAEKKKSSGFFWE